jgi:hypothetical protein
MSKKPTRPPQRPAQAEPDEVDLALIDVAEWILSEHFFDPDAEDEYKRKHALNRGRQESTLLREEGVQAFDKDCAIRLEGLRSWTKMRVTLRHPDFGAVVEGMWSFDTEELRRPEVTQRSGEAATITAGVREVLDHLTGALSDEDLMETFGYAEDEEPLIGDDPREPPPATGADRSRVKAIAKRVERDHGAIGVEDRAWMEQAPQVLPVLTDLLIGMGATAQAEDRQVAVYLGLLEASLEFVRYRADREWPWAIAMLVDYQEKLLAFGREASNRELFLEMTRAMMRARVPVADSMRQAFAEAGLPEQTSEPPKALDAILSQVLTQLAETVGSPFEVIASLADTGAAMPAGLRGFFAARLAESEHAVIRDAVVLLLLDEEASVREAAAAALARSAASGEVSADTLRRAVAIRNWMPEAERAGIDEIVRPAREAGVPIASWPAGAANTEYYATMIDGSAAQSLLMVSRMGRKFVFNALLIRHGQGVVDAWNDPDQSRTKVQRLLKEAQQAVPCSQVSRDFVDTMVRHALSASAERGAVPPVGLLQVAEDIRASEWRAQRLDLVAEVERRIAGTAVPAGIQDEAAAWVTSAETLDSWYEEGPGVHGVLSRLPRNRRPALIDAVLNEILPPRRVDWAERFVLMGLWCEAASEAAYRQKAPAMLAVADALLSDVPMQDIPAMRVIADRTVRNELVTPW